MYILKSLLVFVVVGNFSFAQTILLEPGEKFSVGNQEIVCKSAHTVEKVSVTCRYIFTKYNGEYGTVSSKKDITRTMKGTFEALLSACNSCKSGLNGAGHDESETTCSFDECFENETGKSVHVSYDMKRRLPYECR